MNLLKTLVQQFWRQGCAIVLVFGVVGIALACGIASARRIDSHFPGFFVMANRVVASVSLPHWPVASRTPIYHHVVVAVNGQPVTTAQQVYAIVAGLPEQSPITYTLKKNGRFSRLTLPSLTFTLNDYFLIFVAYLFCGLAIALIGIGVWFLNPHAPASKALLILGLFGGLFALTGADLYFSQWFFPIYQLSEAILPAGFVHLALVFPVEHFLRRRTLALALPYVFAGLLAIVSVAFLYHPSVFSFTHYLCETYTAVAGLIFLGKAVWDYSTTDSHLVRQKIRIVLLGMLSGLAFPVILMFSSGMMGSAVAVNYMAFTFFLFPLSIGYAIVKHDLFEIDAMLRRGVYYLSLTTILTLTYLAAVTVLDLTLRTSEVAQSPLFPLLFTLTVVLFLNPLKESLQRVVDRVFFRLRYNPKKVLEGTSASLASTLQIDTILSLIWNTIQDTVRVTRGGLFLHSPDSGCYVFVYPPIEHGSSLLAPHPLIRAIREKEGNFSRYDLDSDTFSAAVQTACREAFDALDAELIVPVLFQGDLLGLIVLGRKESGTFFSGDDVDFLITLANQGALSISHARAYQEIQDLNVGLEHKVEERTQALAQANAELHTSLVELEHAYGDLQRSQENLVRAEKMAALGRLTAGIAHEMNTPLGASLSSLKLIRDLVREYQAAVDDPDITPSDHRDIAAEMDNLVQLTQQWMEKATAHIRSLKLHTRDLQQGHAQDFSVLEMIEDVQILLAHRLRLSQCTVTVTCPTPQPILYGDPSKLGQVLTNLIVNAIDAYKEAGSSGGDIRLEVNEEPQLLEIRVCDQGCGIAEENREQIFDELFSTKPLGEGTGLGLSIARDIVTNFFGGTIQVESALGQGSTFLLRLPRRESPQPQPLSKEHAERTTHTQSEP